MWRCFIPVRSVIHSSLVSSVAERSSFVTILSGTEMPQPGDDRAGHFAALLPEHGDAHQGRVCVDQTARVHGRTQPRTGDLAVACLAPQVLADLDDLAQAGGADRMTPRDESSARVDADRRCLRGRSRRPPLRRLRRRVRRIPSPRARRALLRSWRREARQVDVARADACCLPSLFCDVAEPFVVLGVPGSRADDARDHLRGIPERYPRRAPQLRRRR